MNYLRLYRRRPPLCPRTAKPTIQRTAKTTRVTRRRRIQNIAGPPERGDLLDSAGSGRSGEVECRVPMFRSGMALRRAASQRPATSPVNVVSTRASSGSCAGGAGVS